MTAKAKQQRRAPKAHAGRPNNSTEISKLLARYRFLEADQSYKAAVAATVEESGEARSAHSKELERFRHKLASAAACVNARPGACLDLVEVLCRECRELLRQRGFLFDQADLGKCWLRN
jgi:hypothetical protein